MIKRALRTADTRQAKIDALDLASRYAPLFTEIERQGMRKDLTTDDVLLCLGRGVRLLPPGQQSSRRVYRLFGEREAQRQLIDSHITELLLQARETERGGIKVHIAAIEAAVNDDLHEEWQEYLAETHRHEAELVAAACVVLAEAKDHPINPSSALIDHVSECCRWQHSVFT